MSSPIWSLSRLDSLLQHQESSVQHWAAGKLFLLYPHEAQARLPELLSSNRPAVVARALENVGDTVRDDLVSILGQLFISGEAEISARAIMKLGEWKSGEGLERIKERIIDGRSLAREQIVAMIYALGRIPLEGAYHLLKQTETSIQDKGSGHWQAFYTSLLGHHRPEDVETLMGFVTDMKLDENMRSQALGILLGSLDLGLNPTDAFFANHTSLREYWLELIRQLEGMGPGGDSLRMLDSIKNLLAESSAHELSLSLPALTGLVSMTEGLSEYPVMVFHKALALLQEASSSESLHYGIFCAAVAGFLSAVEEAILPVPQPDADWKEEVRYLFRNRPEREPDAAVLKRLIQKADSHELTSMSLKELQEDPESWGALRALEILGRIRALSSIPDILSIFSTLKDDLSFEATRKALGHMGLEAVPHLVRWLDPSKSPDRERLLALEILTDFPTEEGIAALLGHFSSLLDKDGSIFLGTLQETGAAGFLELLESEYRPGEADVGRAYVHLCRVNEMHPARLKQIERDVRNVDAILEDHRRMMSGEQRNLPRSILFQLACKECGRKYTYEVHDLHVHPRSGGQEDKEPSDEKDMTPYRQGVVIVDDLRCKNCRALNRFELTRESFMQLTSESLKLMAFTRAGIQIPSHYPVKLVSLDKRDGEPLTLEDAELEHLNAVDLASGKPASHVALAKFYEYVKEYAQARKEYLAALDLDSRALEALAGLARLTHAEGDLSEASRWISDCYQHLDDGHVYIAKDIQEFKKTVREKRSEYLRESGMKTEEPSVKIRFKMDTPDHPKNKPCPCGSGKKYKLCCMNKEGL